MPTAPATGGAPADRPAAGLDARALAEIAGLITAPTAGLAALGFYFGWRRTQTYAAYFGIDNSVLGFSVQEYVMRSSTSIYRIVLAGVGIGLAIVGVHRFLGYGLDARARRRAGAVLLAGGTFLLLVWADAPLNRLLGGVPAGGQAALAVAAGALAAGARHLPGLLPGLPPAATATASRAARPLAALAALALLDAGSGPTLSKVLAIPYLARDTVLAAGVVVVMYGYHLIRRTESPAGRPVPPWVATLSFVFAALLVAAGLFAATDEYADAVGIEEAELTVARLEDRRGVIVYSKDDLRLPPSVTCRQLAQDGDGYRFRCEGLRLFVQTSQGVLALPRTWSRDDGLDDADRMIVIPAGDDIRLEFTPGESDLPYDAR